MTHTPAATSLQLARAETLSKALTRRGWTGRREPQGAHPGAVAAIAHTRRGIRALILTLGGRHGQMIEITAEASIGQRGHGGRRVREVKPSWRLTAYDPPVQAMLAAATAAVGDASDVSQRQHAGWTIEQAPARKIGTNPVRMVRATRFTRPDGVVSATFHVPTYNPPCEHCAHHGELGDTGGWIITGPGFTAEATAHTPSAVIAAFAHALPGGSPVQPAPMLDASQVRSQRGTKSVPAAVDAPGTRLTAAVS